MSNEIQSISQSNYVLHNIDAKKLYVQEPLFTANSGDAVYVGWRPDETVLWENSAGVQLRSGIDLSESRLNFDRLKIYMSNSENNNQEIGIYEWPQIGVNTGTSFRWGTLFPYNINSGGFMLMWNVIGTANNTHIQSNMSYYIGASNFTGGANPSYIGGNNAQVPTVYKVVGINRKENA